jgi:ribosomal protein L40E
MSPIRPKLTLDEQSFEGLLAAAFTIQQHNDRKKNPPPDDPVTDGDRRRPSGGEVCRHCGAPSDAFQTSCQNCGVENFRPGERLQRTWASMWLMSQEKGFPTEDAEKPELLSRRSLPDTSPNEEDISDSNAALDLPASDLQSHTHGLDIAHANDAELRQEESDDAAALALNTASNAQPGGLLDLRVKLRFHRADLYLGISILVAFLAIVWPLPVQQGVKLRPWERMLIAMGIAEAPPPAKHFPGDPNIKVWVDTHTALYYCPADELYGKSADGHFSTQHEAQSDRFKAAERRVCVE